MKFEIGDLVKFKQDSAIYSVITTERNFGIIKDAVVLLEVNDNDQNRKYWAYNVLVAGKTYKNIPEEILEKL